MVVSTGSCEADAVSSQKSTLHKDESTYLARVGNDDVLVGAVLPARRGGLCRNIQTDRGKISYDAPMAVTISRPSMTLPNTTCLPSSHDVVTVQMNY